MQNVVLSVHCHLLLSYVTPFDEGVGAAQSPRAFPNECLADSTGAQCFSFIAFKQGDSRLGYVEACPRSHDNKVGEGSLRSPPTYRIILEAQVE